MGTLRSLLLRKSVVVVVVLALAVVGAWLALRTLTSSRSIAARLRRLAREKLNCEAQVQEAHFGFLSGLDLTGLKLRFGDDEPWLEVGKLRIRLRTAALLLGGFEPQEILVERPVVRLTDGTLDALRSIRAEPTRKVAFPPLIRIYEGQVEVGKAVLGHKAPALAAALDELVLSNPDREGRRLEFRSVWRLGSGGPVALDGVAWPQQKKAEVHAAAKGFRPGRLPLADLLAASGRRPVVEKVQGAVSVEADCRISWADGKPALDYSARAVLEGLGFEAAQLPAPLRGLRGEVVASGRRVSVLAATGWLGGSPFDLRRLDLAFGAAGRLAELAVSARVRNLPAEVLASPTIPERVHKVIAEIGLATGRGRLDLDIELTRDADGTLAGTIAAVADGLVLRPRAFRYPLPPLAARVDYDLGAKFVKVADVRAAGHGLALDASGSVSVGSSPVGFSFVGFVRGLSLDAALRAALPEQGQKVWDELGIGGGSLDARVALATAPDGDPLPRAVVDLDRVKLHPKAFPYPIPPLSGRLRYSRQKGIDILGVEGEAGGTTMAVSGTVVPDGKATRLNLHVAASGVRLDADLRKALPEEVRKFLDENRIEGAVDFDGAVRATPGSTTVAGTITLCDCSAAPKQLPHPLRGINGKVVVGHEGVVFRGLTAEFAGAKLRIEGRYRTGEGRALERLSLVARGLEVDRPLLAALPEEVRRTLEPLDPAGKLDLELSYRAAEGGARLELTARPRGMAATVGGGDDAVRVENLVGELHTDGKVLTLVGLRGTVGAIPFEAQGTVGLAAASPASRLTIRVPPTAMSAKRLEGLPPGIAATLKGLKPSGTLEALVSLRREPGAERMALGSLSARFERFGLAGARLKGLFGTVSLTGSAGKGPMRLAADLPQARVAGLDFRSLVASGAIVGGSVRLEQVRWGFYGGTVGGRLAIGLGETPSYFGHLELADVDVARLLRALGRREETVSGQLHGNVWFKGEGSGAAGLVVKGALSIRRGALYELPVLATVWNVLSLRLPGRGALTDAHAEFEIRHSTLHLHHFLLTGTTTPMDVNGTVVLAPDPMDQELDLVFTVAKERGVLDRLPMVGWLKQQSYNRLRRYFLQARVTGTVAHPRVEVLSHLARGPIEAFGSFLRRVSGTPAPRP